MKFGIVQFPGSNCDGDVAHVVGTVLGQPWRYVWHGDRQLGDVDCVVLPGGFSYGDHLRAGAIARFSPVMAAVARHAERGGLTIGICNGFQILAEAGLLPGALLRNDGLEFRCDWVDLSVERADTAFTHRYEPGQRIRMPIAHGEGRYYVDASAVPALNVAFRYLDNPNGSVAAIAGVVNARGNVLGLMPHPERCAEPELGGSDGRPLFESIVESAVSV
ncbi:MAG TPA: phosphoribosylformylglycinamidine synthase subunit PurQ [Chloroflexota bacterium]|jgi:phosphoribosylformylglycinamidine synthase